jgi:hypothetical protein
VSYVSSKYRILKPTETTIRKTLRQIGKKRGDESIGVIIHK